ncbi:MAG: hypothetical protein ABH822_01040 [Patescibacteria group bacterium]
MSLTGRLADPIGIIIEYCQKRYGMKPEVTRTIVINLRICDRRTLFAKALAEIGID